MRTALALIVLVAAVVWAWRSAMHARETAIAMARNACRRRGAQFLDDTVSLARVRLARSPRGHVTLRRIYEFECSFDGSERVGGVVVITGQSVDTVHVPDPRAESPPLGDDRA